MRAEPILTDEDKRIWAQWTRCALARARTLAHARVVDGARVYYDEALAAMQRPYIAFSGGKDSSAMLHLLASFGYAGRAAWLSGDFDWPGEAELVAEYGRLTGLEIDVLRQPVSSWALLCESASEYGADDESFWRQHPLASQQFFPVFMRYREAHALDGVFLALRAEESKARRILRHKRGGVYYATTRREWVCQPICRWTGLDVYAYLLSRDLPMLPLYRCLRLPQRTSQWSTNQAPDRVRHDGWFPGQGGQRGEMIWLRAYFPSLYRKLLSILPDASRSA